MNQRAGQKSQRREIPIKEVNEFTIIDNRELRQRIAAKAYELYQCRGCCDGRDLDDWLEAERLVKSECGCQGQSERG